MIDKLKNLETANNKLEQFLQHTADKGLFSEYV